MRHVERFDRGQKRIDLGLVQSGRRRCIVTTRGGGSLQVEIGQIQSDVRNVLGKQIHTLGIVRGIVGVVFFVDGTADLLQQ